MKYLILLASLTYGHAAIIDVCASGCDYTNSNLQTAVNNAVRGDIIELKAGEVYEVSVRLPYKSAGSGVVLIRTDRWAELPPIGTRVTLADASLMPKLQPPSTVEAVFYSSPEEKLTTNVDISTDTITTGTHGYANGEPLNTRFSGGTIPSPLAMGVTYYARDVTSTTFKVAALPGDAAIDLTGSATIPTVWRWNSQRSGSGYAFQGLEIRKKVGQNTSGTLIMFGRGEEYSRAAIGSNFTVQHSIIHGVKDESGPNICLAPNVRNFTIRDNLFYDCIRPSNEGKAIAYWQSPGPGLIENNLIEGGSINLLVGGSGLITYGGIVSGDEGQITIRGNYFRKPLYYKYSQGTSGSGAPSGGCSDGAKYLNTANGQWYLCSSSTWSTGPTCAEGEYYRATDATQSCGSGACWSCNASGVFETYGVLRSSGYLVKNLLELKSATNHLIEGNVFDGNWNESQNGTAVQLASKVDQPGSNDIVNVENIRFRDNIILNSMAGLRTATQGGVSFTKTNNRITVDNVLLNKIGITDYPSIDRNDSVATGMSFAGPCDACTFEHFTIINKTTGGQGVQFDTAAYTNNRLANSIYHAGQYGNTAPAGTVAGFWGNGNLINTIGVDYANTKGAPASMGAYATNGNWITTAIDLFTSTTNFRLLPTSPYSASCVSGCAYTGTDGKDLGVDMDRLESKTAGSIPGTPSLGNSIKISVGSTRAIVRYTAPSASACALKLYTDIGRVTLASDTDSGPEQADDRTGNVTSGTSRQFVLGSLSASTPYWGIVTCDTSVGYFSLRTVATRPSFNTLIRFSGTTTGNYSSSADMSSPTSACSGSTCTVPMSSNSVMYFQPTGGGVTALVN